MADAQRYAKHICKLVFYTLECTEASKWATFKSNARVLVVSFTSVTLLKPW